MKLSTRSSGTWQHTLDVEIPAETAQAGLDAIARRVQQRVALAGFRKGKAPLDLVRNQFASHIEQDFLEEHVPRMASEAVAEAKLSPVIPPAVRNLHFTPGSPLRFEVIVDVRPDIEAKNYQGLPLSRRAATVDDDAVQQALDGLREESAVFADLARPAERGDVVLLDSTRLDANGRRLSATRQKALRVQLGAPGMLPDLENGLLGASEGQERTIEIQYPADYSNPELAGKSARYVVKVRKIQEKKLRDLDDNLARDVFQLETLDELRSRVRLNLEGEERVRIQREVDGALAEELIRRNEFELPPRLEQWMLERVISEAVGERSVDEQLLHELESRYRPGVQRSLKREILLAAIARQEHLTVGDDDVAAEIDRLANSDPRQGARIRARYQSEERRQGLREALLERKALDWLSAAADVKEVAAGEPAIVVPAGR
jgi:trigger factor